jgi:hypothetical protein
VTPPTVEQAALNNALWCASVVRCGGGAAHFAPTLWWSVRPPPRYYPRAITLSRNLDEGARQRLARLEPGDAVKDSFACLPAAGFEPLFEAQWYWRAPAVGAQAEALLHPGELASWVEAWGGGAEVLPPALLEEPGVTFLAEFGAADVEAGCALYAGAGLVGVSNLFGPPAAQARLLAGAAAHAGPLPLVTYEQEDAAVGPLQAAGFQALGPLRVLLKQA